MIRLALVAVFLALPAHAFDLQGHRGARGLAPENTARVPEGTQTLKRGGYAGYSLWLAGFAPELHGDSVPRAVLAAGGKIWAPNHTFLTPAMLAEARALGIVVIPWTVNEPSMIAKLLDMGVDGIISDRPDLVQIEINRRR